MLIFYTGAAQNALKTSQLTPTTEHHSVPTTEVINSNSTTTFPQIILVGAKGNSQSDLENILAT